MAPTTNAERQALYRKRLKERASLDAMGSRAADAVNQAIDALWSFFSRPVQSDGSTWADFDGCDTVADFRRFLARNGAALADYCRTFRDDPPAGMTAGETSAISIVADIADAIELAAERSRES
jgi:hypothetical protein